MEWVGCIRCEKFQNDFMAQTCALISPIQPILHWVSCSNEILPNAPKHNETHTNMSLGSNWVCRVHSLRKIPKRLHGPNLCINCTSSTHFPLSFVYHETLPNASKYNEMHQNMSLGSNGWIGCVRCEKFQCDFVARTFALIAPVQPILHQASCSNETIQNAPKHYET